MKFVAYQQRRGLAMYLQWPKFVILCLFAAVSVSVQSAEPFALSSLPGISIGGALPSDYEASGITWHSGLQKLFLVSDCGVVSSMTDAGTELTHWTLEQDLEAVTVAFPRGDFIYLGVEHPDSIYEFNIVEGRVTRIFDLTPWMDGPKNDGLEALTFVPDPADPEGGLFYAGMQDTGRIFVFRLPISSCTDSTVVTPIGSMLPLNDEKKISGLDYAPAQGVIYAIYDNADLLRVITPDGDLVGQWDLPRDDQEGVTLKGRELYICEDYGEEGSGVYCYTPFMALPQPDLNADGKVNLQDFSILGANWNRDENPTIADVDGDNRLNLADMAILTEVWLQGA